MPLVGHVAELLVDDLSSGDLHLPSAAVSAQVHHPLGAVDLDPRGVLGPIGKLLAGADVARRLRANRRETGVLEGDGHLVELEADDVHVGHVTVVVVTPAPADAGDGVGVGWITQRHAGQVQLVDTVGGVAAGKIPITVPVAMNRGVIGPLRRRAQPLVPIEPCRRIAVGRLSQGITAVHRAQHVVDLRVEHVAEPAFFDVLPGGRGVGATAGLGAGLDDAFVFSGGLDHLAAFADLAADALLHVDVLSGLAGQHRAQGVPLLRGGDQHAVDVLVVEDFAHLLCELGGGPLDLLQLRHGAAAAGVLQIADEFALDVLQRGHLSHHVPTPPAGPQQGNHHLFVGRLSPSGGVHRRSRRQHRCALHRLVHKIPASDLCHDVSPYLVMDMVLSISRIRPGGQISNRIFPLQRRPGHSRRRLRHFDSFRREARGWDYLISIT